MISSYLLLTDIRDKLKETFRDFPFREPLNHGQPFGDNGEKSYRDPLIRLMRLPLKDSGETFDGQEQGEDFPFAVVKFLRGSTARMDYPKTSFVIGVVFGVFNPDDDDTIVQDAMNMRDRIEYMFATNHTWADGHFIREDPIESSMNTDGSDMAVAPAWPAWDPYLGGVVVTKFSARSPELEPGPDFF